MGVLERPPQPRRRAGPAGADGGATGTLRPRDHAVFPGRLDHRQLLMGDKAVAQSLNADDGDYRDWDAIEAWAARVAEDLAG